MSQTSVVTCVEFFRHCFNADDKCYEIADRDIAKVQVPDEEVFAIRFFDRSIKTININGQTVQRLGNRENISPSYFIKGTPMTEAEINPTLEHNMKAFGWHTVLKINNGERYAGMREGDVLLYKPN